MSDRKQMLAEILDANPNDAFARYGLAMEHSNAGEVEPAIQNFQLLIEAHPDYAAGFFMAAQLLARVGRTAEARNFLQNGIASAARTGNTHAQGEMQAMLDDLT